ncbi:MAG: hypothetical protein ACI9Y1_000674 [Lentisphaeria bacterium]|jgi:hypothetical protein
MAWNRLFSSLGQTQWHSLEDIVQSAFADVINADVQFQLSQAEAWSRFVESVRELSDNPVIQPLDFSVGFGRLENLAIDEIICIPTDKYIAVASWLYFFFKPLVDYVVKIDVGEYR